MHPSRLRSWFHTGFQFSGHCILSRGFCAFRRIGVSSALLLMIPLGAAWGSSSVSSDVESRLGPSSALQSAVVRGADLSQGLTLDANIERGRTGLRVAPAGAGFILQSVDGRGGERYVRVVLPGGRILNSRFAPDSRLDRVWFSRAADSQRRLSVAEQERMREFIRRHAERLHEQDRDALRLLDLAANIIPAEEVLEPFDAQTDLRGQGANFVEYQMICDLRGALHRGVFEARKRHFEVQAMVGEPATRCRGRCGTACEQWGQHRSNQYTQECFNHDLCRDATGENLGECREEFWAAAAGYVMAPDCSESFRPQLRFQSRVGRDR